jgi:hypothetical protein
MDAAGLEPQEESHPTELWHSTVAYHAGWRRGEVDA